MDTAICMFGIGVCDNRYPVNVSDAASVPAGRFEVACAAVENRFFVMGGRSAFSVLDDIWELSLQDDQTIDWGGANVRFLTCVSHHE